MQKAASRAEAARAARSPPAARELVEEVKDEPKHNGDASTSGEKPGGAARLASPLSPKKQPAPADGSAGEFSWKDYLLESHAAAASPAAFRQANEPPANEFIIGAPVPPPSPHISTQKVRTCKSFIFFLQSLV